ncbi:MAG: hypothetical protein J5I90_08455 [Caldilineales bacterium]|nr:hypothetical protein [Caldilineales bacterium]
MGKADLHIHSNLSDGTATVTAILHHASAHTDLDVIAITDHNTLEGAYIARDLAADYRVEVVPGMEISTREGHLLALFLETPVKAGMSFVETAEQVRLFGGLPYAAHPNSSFASSIDKQRLRQIVRDYPGLLAGVEAENGSVVHLRENAVGRALRWQTGMPGIGNSDAHNLHDIGCAATAFAGQNAADLRRALESGAVVPLPVQRTGRFWRRNAAYWAMRYGAGLVEALEVRTGRSPHIRWMRHKAA